MVHRMVGAHGGRLVSRVAGSAPGGLEGLEVPAGAMAVFSVANTSVQQN